MPNTPQPKADSRTLVADLLFEIGTEELPAAYLPSLIDQLASETRRLFESQHLPLKSIQSFGTPRRLVLIVRELTAVQRMPGEEVRGPSKQAAYDASGTPTPALLGFLRSQGGTEERIKVVATEKGEYLYLVKPPRTTPTATLLPQLLPRLLGSLRAPKTMRWDASGVRFARPIRWLLARYGAQPIRCSFGMLASGSRTWVGGPLRPRAVSVTSLDGYFRTLQRAGVILDAAERRAWIEQTVVKLAAQVRAKLAPEMIPRLARIPPFGGTGCAESVYDTPAQPAYGQRARRGMISHGLLEEVTHLVEHPVPLVGSFDAKYLDLPREVLLASMAKYQRVFAMESRGKIVPRFVAILEGKPKRPAEVRRVIERILNARLADSLMFWNEDHKRLPLSKFGSLDGVTFHEKLGSMEQKTQRLFQLSSRLAEMWELTHQEREWLARACLLAKMDLISAMVKEFPTLQGVVGKHYALDSNESKEVAVAVEEHYLPLAGKSPNTLIGRALAIIDKYDTLASYFAIGIEPTGDQDPFGLRRAAQGIVEIAAAAGRRLSLDDLLEAQAALPPLKGLPKEQLAAIGHRLRQYVLERLYSFAWPQTSEPTTDVIDAVLASRSDDLVDVMERVRSLARMNGEAGLRKAAKVIERTRNILKSATIRQPKVDPDRFSEEPERTLWNVYEQHREKIDKLREERLYEKATEEFGRAFFDPLHEFFEGVLVNDPNESLQQNRLALMHAINTLYTERIADLSKLTMLQQREESHA